MDANLKMGNEIRKQIKLAANRENLRNTIFVFWRQKMQEKYPDFDFETQDESGKTMQTYVLEHMVQNRIPDFNTAFVSLYHDQIVDMRARAAAEKQAKEVQKNTKQGIIDISSTSRKDKQPISNLGSMSYDQIADMAKKELGLG